jgi:hypothetical protein
LVYVRHQGLLGIEPTTFLSRDTTVSTTPRNEDKYFDLVTLTLNSQNDRVP